MSFFPALADGTWIVVGVVVLTLAGVVIGLFTRSGSEVEEHPRGPNRLR